MVVGRIERKPAYPKLQTYKKDYTPPPPPPEKKLGGLGGVRTPTDQLVTPPAKELSAVVGGSKAIAEAPPPDDDFGFAPPTAPTLGVGTTGPEVASMQERLIAAGFDPGPVDGIFGPLTEAGVKSFQEAAGLPADGVATPELFAVLDALENPPPPEVPAGAPPSEEVGQAPVTAAPTQVPADPTQAPAEAPAFGSQEVRDNLARLPNPEQDPQVFMFAVDRAAADFQNRLSNGQTAQDPQVISQDLQALATAYSAAGEAGQAKAQALATLAQLAVVPGVPQDFQQELIRSFTNDGGNVKNIERAIQMARDIEDPQLTQALYTAIGATVPAAISASPDGDKEALQARGTLAATLGDPNVTNDVRRRLGQGFNGDKDFDDFTNALKDAKTKEDFTAILAFQLANPEAIQEETKIDFTLMAQTVQTVANNFEALDDEDVGLRMGELMAAMARGDDGRTRQILKDIDEVATGDQKEILKSVTGLAAAAAIPFF